MIAPSRIPIPSSDQGKTTKLTPQRQEVIVNAIRRGLPRMRAHILAGIESATFYYWLKRGEEGEEPFASFRTAIMKAEVELEMSHIEVIEEASHEKREWTAAMTWLERRDPATYGKRDRLDVKHDISFTVLRYDDTPVIDTVSQDVTPAIDTPATQAIDNKE